jgi:gluconate:H+ symporter, GntP family
MLSAPGAKKGMGRTSGGLRRTARMVKLPWNYGSPENRRNAMPLLLLVLSILFIVVATARWGLHPFLALLAAAFGYGILAGMPLQEVVQSVNGGFGDTIGYIGIVILAGSIIGTFLEKSGGAYRLAETALQMTGKRHVPLAMTGVGYVVSLPVFCDSGFVLLAPLNRALAQKAGTTLAAGAVALSLGLYATHTMVPPTPGPIAAAGIIEADLGLVVVWGLVVSAAAALTGWLFATRVAARVWIDPSGTEGGAKSAPTPAEAPSATKSLLPIVLPIVLLVARSIAELPAHPLGEGHLRTVLSFLGQPTVALLVGAVTAFLLPKKFDRTMLSGSGWVGEAVVAAATIIVVTGAGGAFGRVLQNSGIAELVGTLLEGREGIGIGLPFLIAAGIKTAQGSSTVAIITTAGIVAPLLAALGLDSATAKALVVVGIGAGAMVVSHANDSYFWVVTQFSGMSLSQGYRLQSLGTLVQGVAAALALWCLSAVLL